MLILEFYFNVIFSYLYLHQCKIGLEIKTEILEK